MVRGVEEHQVEEGREEQGADCLSSPLRKLLPFAFLPAGSEFSMGDVAVGAYLLYLPRRNALPVHGKAEEGDGQQVDVCMQIMLSKAWGGNGSGRGQRRKSRRYGTSLALKA